MNNRKIKQAEAVAAQAVMIKTRYCPLHLLAKAGQLRVQVAGQFRGERLQLFELHVEPADLDVVEHPVLVAVRASRMRASWASILLAVSCSRWWFEMRGIGPHFARQLLAIPDQGLIDLVQLGAKLVADHPHAHRNQIAMGVGKRVDAQAAKLAERDPSLRPRAGPSSPASGSSLTRQLRPLTRLR